MYLVVRFVSVPRKPPARAWGADRAKLLVNSVQMEHAQFHPAPKEVQKNVQRFEPLAGIAQALCRRTKVPGQTLPGSPRQDLPGIPNQQST